MVGRAHCSSALAMTMGVTMMLAGANQALFNSDGKQTCNSVRQIFLRNLHDPLFHCYALTKLSISSVGFCS